VLLSTTLLRLGDRTMADLQPRDSFLIGLAQALALIPGISRSGMTISAGLARGLERVEAARFAFLLGIPVIAGAGLLQMAEALRMGEPIPGSVWVGVVVAGLAGYAAIAILLKLLTRVGLAPFAAARATAFAATPCTATSPSVVNPSESSVGDWMMTPDTSVPSEKTRLTAVPCTAPIGSGTGTAQLSAGSGDAVDTNERTIGSPESMSVPAVTPMREGNVSEPTGI
jgi:hypothetical protein